MITLIYKGKAITDKQCEVIYAKIKEAADEGRDFEYLCTSPNLYTRVRLGVVEGDLFYENVRFIIDGEPHLMNQYAQLAFWPEGFLDYEINLVEQLIMAQMAKHKKNHPERFARKDLNDELEQN